MSSLLLSAYLYAEPAPTPTAPTTGSSVLDILLNFGVLGIVFIAAALGYVYFRPSVNELREDKKVLRATNATLLATNNDKTLPALEKAVSAMKATADQMVRNDETLRQVQAVNQKLIDEISSLRQQNEKFVSEVAGLRISNERFVSEIAALRLEVAALKHAGGT